MTVYPEKRGDTQTGYWYGELKHKKAGRFRRRFKTKDLASSYETHVKAFGQEPDWAKDQDATEVGLTFKAVADELKAAGGPEGIWARSRDRGILQRLAFVCASKIGTTAVEKVSYAMAEEFANSLRNRPGQSKGEKLSPATINRYLTAISSVLSYAERKEYIERTPQLPWQKEPKKKKHTYSEAQQATVERWLVGQGWATEAFFVGLLARGGLRAGELLGLKPEQIEDDFIVLDDPERIKNEETREVYIGTESANRLRALVREGRMPTYKALYTRLVKANETCGYNIPRPVHALRHTAATRTVSDEQDIQIAQQLLGHRNIKTTLGYRHVSREVLRERAEKLNPQRGQIDENTAQPEIVDFKKRA